MEKSDDQVKTLFEPAYNTTLGLEECRQIENNLVGYFRILLEIAKETIYADQSD